MGKVIFVDWNEKSFQLQPQNSFGLKKWEGTDDDRTLIDLADFLRSKNCFFPKQSLKTLDTFGCCQRPVFSLFFNLFFLIPTYATNYQSGKKVTHLVIRVARE